jgi:hypothetical protein
MTPELQSVVDRLELVERQNGTLRGLAVVALMVAAIAIAVPFVIAKTTLTPAPPAHTSVIDTNRLLLRDLDGRLVGGMEVDRSGTVRLVLGANDGRSSAAFLEVRRDSFADLTLRGPDGGVRATLLGSRLPMLMLAPEGSRPTVTLASSASAGSIALGDVQGRLHFRAP